MFGVIAVGDTTDTEKQKKARINYAGKATSVWKENSREQIVNRYIDTIIWLSPYVSASPENEAYFRVAEKNRNWKKFLF